MQYKAHNPNRTNLTAHSRSRFICDSKVTKLLQKIKQQITKKFMSL